MAVLNRTDLEQSPLADLHTLAADLGIEGFRRMRKADLIDVISPPSESGGETTDAVEEKKPARARKPRARARVEPAKDEAKEKAVERADEEQVIGSGVLDVLGNGSGFLRAVPDTQSPEDIYISPAQIRRCELRSGDEVSGPVRPPRRSERYPSLVRVQLVNGVQPEAAADRPRFEGLPIRFATERLLAPAGLEQAAFGRGSRVLLSGPARADAGAVMRLIAAKLAEHHKDLTVAVALIGVRPEEVAQWGEALGEGVSVVGGSYDGSASQQAEAAQAAIEAAKRSAEQGEHTALIVDSLDALAPEAARRVMAAGRQLEAGGSVTVVASGTSREAERQATTWIVLRPGADGAPAEVDAEQSGTWHAELLSSS
ncbi:MAG: Rho termination factor N-terminal domain-containing protein [Thermoleophilaceae bacterium]|nr:Rho termination factor N-terminal domain-containing protein [Thermoleophilaceae bacterium]